MWDRCVTPAGPIRAIPVSLPRSTGAAKLVDCTAHGLRDYMEDGERFQTRLFWPLDPAMPEAVPSGLLSYKPVNSFPAKAWLRWISVTCRSLK